MIIKKGQVITFDIKYGGEPEPEVKWMKGEEVTIDYIHIILTDHLVIIALDKLLSKRDKMLKALEESVDVVGDHY